MALPKEDLVFKGTLIGHSDWVTQIAINPRVPDSILSSSRDKTLIIWKLKLNDDPDKDDSGNYGYPLKRLHGHGHFITDVVISNDNGKDGNFALSGSWDKTIRLWDLNVGKTTKRFVGHTNDVLSVAFSPDNRQIVSGSRDKSIKLWNTKAQCKYSIQEQDAHTAWVSCVRFSPSVSSSPIIVSAGWDRMVKVWNLANCKLKTSHIGHTGYLNTVTVSPDGSLCASGGRDYKVMLWDLTEGKHLYTLEHKDIINALCFYPKLSPNKYWLCVATGPTIKVWDLENKNLVDELKLVDTSIGKPVKPPQCTSLAWSVDGATLFAGFTDNQIRVWQLVPKEQFNS